MLKIAEFLLGIQSFRAALEALGWSPPAVEPKGGGSRPEE